MASKVIGIDMGGTHIRAAAVAGGKMGKVITSQVSATESADVVLNELFALTDQLMNKGAEAIGIGVPSVVDVKNGIVYDVQNIPSWKEIPLKKYMEARYGVPVMVNNDANCFALGEKYFGKGKKYESFVGLVLGTGLGAGILIDGKLYSGHNCGAGEFGMVSYLDYNYEYYASGQFFKNCHNISGYDVYDQARAGEEKALSIFKEFGTHLGKAIQTILYCYDVECIIIGGSISHAYNFYKKAMWEEVKKFAYPRSLKDFDIKVSSLARSGILGAAGLYYNEVFRNIAK